MDQIVIEEFDEEYDTFDDYTLVSPWEKFIAAIESKCREWDAMDFEKLKTQAIASNDDSKNYIIQKEFEFNSKFYSLFFYFSFPPPPPSPPPSSSSFSSNSIFSYQFENTNKVFSKKSIIQKLFGVNDYIILSPSSMSGVVLNMHEASFLLSTMAVALSSSKCNISSFIPIHDPTRISFVGFFPINDQNLTIHFQSEKIKKLNRIPNMLTTIDGIYDHFLSKIQFKSNYHTIIHSTDMEMNLVHVYTIVTKGHAYDIDNATVVHNVHADYEFEDDETLHWDKREPWSAWQSMDDPIKGFELTACWHVPSILDYSSLFKYENISLDSANDWYIRPLLLHNSESDNKNINCFSHRLFNFINAMKFSKKADYMEEFLSNDSKTIRKLNLYGMTVPPPSVRSKAINSIFHNHESYDIKSSSTSSSSLCSHHYVAKTAPPFSLLANFCLQALKFGDCNIKTIAFLWSDFVKELRWHWDELKIISNLNVNNDMPDYAFCLIHQKLQLLQICIKRQKELLSKQKKNSTSDSSDLNLFKIDNYNDNDDVDEYFDDEEYKNDNEDGNESCYESCLDSENDLMDLDSNKFDDADNDDKINNNNSQEVKIEKEDEEEEKEKGKEVKEEKENEEEEKEKGKEVKEEKENEDEDKDKDEKEEEEKEKEKERENGKKQEKEIEREGEGEGEGEESEEIFHKRKGFIKPINDLYMLNFKRKIYEPKIQNPFPMTEDILEEKQKSINALSKCSNSNLARAKLQGDVLFSDMCAFQACNPGSVLEDFVRWHSPRDWIPDEQSMNSNSKSNFKTDLIPEPASLVRESNIVSEPAWPPRGRLSERMEVTLEEGNFWKLLWNEAVPEPADEQKPLFDHVREAEKILHYLETIQPATLLPSLLCIALTSTLHLLCTASGSNVACVVQERKKIEEYLAAMDTSGEQWLDEIFSEYPMKEAYDVCERISNFEMNVVKSSSLLLKLGSNNLSLINKIMLQNNQWLGFGSSRVFVSPCNEQQENEDFSSKKACFQNERDKLAESLVNFSNKLHVQEGQVRNVDSLGMDLSSREVEFVHKSQPNQKFNDRIYAKLGDDEESLHLGLALTR